LLESESFNAYKNVTAPIIVMLGHLEVDMEVSDPGIETTESNDCRKMLGDNGDTNDILAMTRDRTRFSHKNRQNFINPFI